MKKGEGFVVCHPEKAMVQLDNGDNTEKRVTKTRERGSSETTGSRDSINGLPSVIDRTLVCPCFKVTLMLVLLPYNMNVLHGHKVGFTLVYITIVWPHIKVSCPFLSPSGVYLQSLYRSNYADVSTLESVSLAQTGP